MNINRSESSYSKIPWLLLSRLFIFILLLIIVVLFFRVPDFLVLPFTIYSFVTLALLLLIAFDLRQTQKLLFSAVVILQLILEIAVETGVVHHTGGINSPFAILYVLTILSASLAYSLIGGVAMAGLSSLAYVSILWFEEALEFSFKSLLLISDAAFYETFLYICTFFLVAFISGYFAQKLKVKGEQLWSASLELNKIKADTGEILKHLKSGLITIDTWGRIVYFNRSAEEILGYSEAEVKGKDCRVVFKQRMPRLAEKIIQVVRFNQEDSRGFLYIEDKNNRKIPIGISTSILGDRGKGVRGVIAVFQDITEVMKLEERIRMADRLAAVGELSAGIAHEIRNPLASISGSVEILKEELSLSEENRKLLDLIIKETGRLNRIVTDFLKYARIGPSMLNKVELIHLLDEVTEIAKKHPSFKENICIKKIFSSHVPYVLGEENQIKQILLNLLVNAMESMEEKGGEILITDKTLNQLDQFYFTEEEPEESEWVAIAIADQGSGMTEEQKEKIFSPFYSTKKNGTGLGLAIVQRLVNNLGGRMEFLSQPGKGSVFVVYLQKYVKRKAKLSQTVNTTTSANLDVCTSEFRQT
ncbi:MAG: PAS domain S-box protein [candidate division Zixibacteria bacterium]|nr:PAS domain S-box protein [candidate division Zixibacteria bacterium]